MYSWKFLFHLFIFGFALYLFLKKVWPYLLGHYQIGSNAEERESQDRAMQAAYET